MVITFQDLIAALNQYWVKHGCTVIQPYTTEVGAGTLHPATALFAVDHKHYRLAYTQPSVRPGDGRYANSSGRVYKHHQYQVMLKPSPEDIKDLYLASLRTIGIDIMVNDVKFIGDDWENPAIGASGVGWEIWLNGTEITQFTYMQQIGGIECNPIAGELAYGLERICMFLQKKDNVYDLLWSEQLTYRDLFIEYERDMTIATVNFENNTYLFDEFMAIESQCNELVKIKAPLAAYDLCLKASHLLNLLDAKNALDTAERASYLLRIRKLANHCCRLWRDRMLTKENEKRL